MHGLTQSVLLKAMGWSLFNSLWQMSLLWAVYHLFVLVFRDAGSRTRHGLAFLLLAAGAGWTLLTFITTYPMGPSAGAWSLPAPLETYGNRMLSVSRWFVDEGLSWCSCCYLIVLTGLLVQYLGHYLHSRRVTRQGLSKIGPGLRVFVAATARTMGIIPSVKVYLSSLVDVPMTLGFLKPVILLPVTMITHLSTQQVEAILVHELGHIRRKDYLIHLLVTAIGLLFFFNPFARMLIGQLKKEREHCCDDLVLQFQYDPHTYVSALLSLARQHRQGRLAVAATGGGNKQLLQRAKKILQQHPTDERPGARPLFLLFLTIGLTFFIWGPRRTPPPPPTAPVVAILPDGALRPVIETDNRPIVNIPSSGKHPVTPSAVAHAAAPVSRHRTAVHHQAVIVPDHEDVSWQNTSGPSKTPAPAYADMVVIDDRDFSIGAPANNDQPAPTPSSNEGFPFVPQSSFSFQSTDTLPPEERLAMKQMATEKAILAQMGQLRQELKARMNVLLQAHAALEKASKSRTLARDVQSGSRQKLDRLIRDELHLQQQYMIQLDNLQRQLQRTVHRLTTVYI